MPDVLSLDESEGRAAFERLKLRAAALPKEQRKRPNVSLKDAAIRALAAYHEAEGLGLRVRLAMFPAELWDVRHYDELPELARACWFIHEQRDLASATATASKVSLEAIEAGRELRGLMLDVLGYNLRSDQNAHLQLEHIRKGAGYADLAKDLFQLADLYQAHQALLAADARHYSPQHVLDARAHAQRILDEISEPSEGSWMDWTLRFWALFFESYAQTQRAVAFAFPSDLDKQAVFGSLRA